MSPFLCTVAIVAFLQAPSVFSEGNSFKHTYFNSFLIHYKYKSNFELQEAAFVLSRL